VLCRLEAVLEQELALLESFQAEMQQAAAAECCSCAVS
jgi:hypothetical protein